MLKAFHSYFNSVAEFLGDILIEINLRNQSKARVWQQELPDCAYQIIDKQITTLPAQASVCQKERRLAVEIFQPVSTYCPYGLLGVHFVPAQTGCLQVQIAISDERGDIWEDSLAGRIDTVRLGLPLEYAPAVLQGVLFAASLKPIGAGSLSFHCAAHGSVGSSPYIFQKVATVVLQLLQQQKVILSVEELQGIIEGADHWVQHQQGSL